MSKRRKMGSFPRQSFPKPDQVKNSHMLQNVGRRRGFCLLAPGFTPWKKGISIPGSTKTTLLREELSDPFFYENSIWTIANVFTLCKWAKNFMVKRDAPKGCPSRSSSSSLSGTLPSRRSQCYSPSLSILCAVSWDLWRITIYIYDMLMTMPPNTFDNLTSGILLLRLQRNQLWIGCFFFLILPIQRLSVQWILS